MEKSQYSLTSTLSDPTTILSSISDSGATSPNVTCALLRPKSNWGFCFQNSSSPLGSFTPLPIGPVPAPAPPHIFEIKSCTVTKMTSPLHLLVSFPSASSPPSTVDPASRVVCSENFLLVEVPTRGSWLSSVFL